GAMAADLGSDDISKLIAACDQEPIHIPNAIQPFGAMLIVEKDTQQIVYASANSAEYFSVADNTIHELSDIKQANINSLLPEHLISGLASAIRENEPIWVETDRLSFLGWRHENYYIIEVERYHVQTSNWFEIQFQRAFQKLRNCKTHNDLINTLTRLIQEISGYDRVMIYQFDPEWNGRVIAESVRQLFTSMLNHHFPASDIPAQARAMYSINPIRIIPDVNAEPQPLHMIHKPQNTEAVNLSSGVLRAVSPLHMQYLRNFGVSASTSIGIFNEDELWGIVACHHTKPRAIGRRIRRLLVRTVEFAAERLWLIHSRNVERYMVTVQAAREQLSTTADDKHSSHEIVIEHAADWCKLFRCDGIGYLRGEELTTYGETPDQTTINKLVEWLEENGKKSLFWHSHMLKEDAPGLLPDGSRFAGLLAIPLKSDADLFSYLLLFRVAQNEVRTWAGKPEKLSVETSTGTMLGPRKSFEAWQDEVSGKSQPWRTAQLYAARDIARDLLIVADVMQLNLLNDQLADANENLEKLVSFDDLTGIFNRRRMEDRLESEVKEAQRYKKQFGILLFDLDKFKSVNDTYGHNIGDQILQNTCAAVSETLRDTDKFGRWGGEEFLIIAPQTGMPELMQLGERVRAAVEKMQHKDLPAVTISIGVAEFQNDTRWDHMIDRADKAMYRAKENGRNQVCSQ
uniref:Diguanylate cyclase (GGDEF) domain-containing protein n=1 Tax=Idiomarina sp. A28L TaxID=1036674 RepID=UPI000D7760A0|nr:Chain A, Diguanylate cyclase (GGDEF) domain-containing protein [Idiomarina sp. A28L]6ET7_B Chain B, Diguanylate cyclase (GGDEF) domain-containing protein [Idiomarina sp. A28L]